MNEKNRLLIEHIKNIIFSREFKNKFRLKETYFTRNRKVGFIYIILTILNLIRKSTQLEIDDFLKQFIYGKIFFTYTKQSFSEARQKISKNAFKFLNQEFIKKFYMSNDYKKYKNFRLLAIDGTFLEIPNNEETQNEYGFVTNGNDCFKLARSISSTIYDLKNDILVNSFLGKYNIGERELAIKNIDELLTFDISNTTNLILFDKAYPSLAFFDYLESKNIKYFMRVKPNFYRQISNSDTFDKIVNLEITKERVKELKKQGFKAKVGEVIIFRMMKFIIDGEEEIVVTNLTKQEVSFKDGIDLFYERWGIETKFDELKNRFEIENFSGTKPITIEQDFYATHLISNIASIIASEAKSEIKSIKKHCKYNYKINKNILVGKLKYTLVEMLIQRGFIQLELIYQRLIFDIKRNLIPVIKGRKYTNKRKRHSNKYHCNARRAL
jgi:hypothetical protein